MGFKRFCGQQARWAVLIPGLSLCCAVASWMSSSNHTEWMGTRSTSAPHAARAVCSNCVTPGDDDSCLPAGPFQQARLTRIPASIPAEMNPAITRGELACACNSASRFIPRAWCTAADQESKSTSVGSAATHATQRAILCSRKVGRDQSRPAGIPSYLSCLRDDITPSFRSLNINVVPHRTFAVEVLHA